MNIVFILMFFTCLIQYNKYLRLLVFFKLLVVLSKRNFPFRRELKTKEIKH